MPHLFTDRSGGYSLGGYQSLNFGLHVGDDPANVLANRRTLTATQFMNQEHGDEVVLVTDLMEIEPNCDAMITTNSNISLAVMVADCIPLLFIAKEAVAAVHVGRAGLLNQIALKTLVAMRNIGAIDVHAILGPSICGKCYEVPFALQQEVITEHPKAFSLTRKGTPGLDLVGALVADLIQHGITYETSTICTLENSLFFSHRRDKPTGRFAGVVSI